MDIKEAIKGRISVRAFQDKPVAKEVIYDVLDTARWAQSGTNTQPWKVVVAQGKTKQTISDALLNAAKNGVKATPIINTTQKNGSSRSKADASNVEWTSTKP